MKVSASQPKPVTKTPVLASAGALVVELREESRFERQSELDNITGTLSDGLASLRSCAQLRVTGSHADARARRRTRAAHADG
jgi:hypothetical protein